MKNELKMNPKPCFLKNAFSRAIKVPVNEYIGFFKPNLKPEISKMEEIFILVSEMVQIHVHK